METQENILEKLMQEQLVLEIQAFKESPTPKVHNLNKLEIFLFKKMFFNKNDNDIFKQKNKFGFKPNLRKLDTIFDLEKNNDISKLYKNYYNSTFFNKIFFLFKIIFISNRLKNRVFNTSKERMFFDMLKTQLHGKYTTPKPQPLTYEEKKKMADKFIFTSFFDHINDYNKTKNVFKKIKSLFSIKKEISIFKKTKENNKKNTYIIHQTDKIEELFN